jgi:hypothetical protein
MAFLSFIKDRQTQQPQIEQQSQHQKSEPTNQRSTEKTSETATPAQSVAQMPEAEKAKARDAASRVEQVGENINQNASVRTDAPTDSASTPEVMRQGMTGNDKSQPPLSPTDGQVANTALEKKTTEMTQTKERDSQSPSPAHTPSLPQRGQDGWER